VFRDEIGELSAKPALEYRDRLRLHAMRRR